MIEKIISFSNPQYDELASEFAATPGSGSIFFSSSSLPATSSFYVISVDNYDSVSMVSISF